MTIKIGSNFARLGIYNMLSVCTLMLVMCLLNDLKQLENESIHKFTQKLSDLKRGHAYRNVNIVQIYVRFYIYSTCIRTSMCVSATLCMISVCKHLYMGHHNISN